MPDTASSRDRILAPTHHQAGTSKTPPPHTHFDLESQHLPARPASARPSTTKRVLLTGLSFILLLAYIALCFFCVLYYGVKNTFNDVTAGQQRFLAACSLLVGVVGPLIAVASFGYAVWVAVKSVDVLAFMRCTLHTGFCLLHGVVVLMPLTVAAATVVSNELRQGIFD